LAKKSRKKEKGGAGTIVADFGHEDAKGGGGKNPRIPAGDYVAKIVSAKQKESESGNQMIVWKFKILEGKYKGKEMTGRTVLTPKSLWVLRNLLEALGAEVPEKKTKVKYTKYIGEKIGISVEDGEYNNKPTSEVNDFLDPEMVGAEDDDEDEDVDDDDLDDDDDDDEDEVDLDEMDRKELKEYIKENELDVKVKKSMDEDAIREAIDAVVDDDDDDDEDDDDEMDEVDLDEL
jgi:hypothetical protein